MKKTPYNIYIHFEKLSAIFKEDANRQENVIRCGLASIELTTYLLGSILKQTENTPVDLVSSIVKGLETQFSLLNAYTWTDKGKNYKNSYSKNIDNLKLLGENYTDAIDRISRLYFGISAQTKVGLEEQINNIRCHFNLPSINIKSVEKSNYKILPDIVETLELDEIAYFNSEDKLFMITHQISECWFNIVINELKSIHESFQNLNTDLTAIEPHFKAAFDILIYIAEHILLLEHMIISDYHPLRVALRGASGGQSHQAYVLFSVAQKTYAAFLTLLKNDSKQIIDLLERPKEHPNLLAILNHFTKLERSLKNFFFQHYILSSNIIGHQSFGSIGYDLIALVDKFVEPIFKEIDQAKYALTLKTNFQYGAFAGTLISKKEKLPPQPKQNNPVDNAITNQVVSAYFETISALDMDRWVKLFTEDGYIEDPVGSRPYIGHQQLAVFFKGVVRFFSQISMTIEKKYVERNQTTVLWKAKAITYNGKKINFNGKEVFQISNKGKILAAQVYWDPSVIANQL